MSLIPAVTEMLFAIGAGNDVVGVSSFDTYPADVRSRPNVGALLDPDLERIFSLKPDLVIVYGSQTDLISRLTRANIPVFRYAHAGLADVMVTIRALGERLGRSAEAAVMTGRIERDLDDIRRRVSGKKRPRTAIVFEREPGTLRNVYASGGAGFMHDLLVIAGGDNVFGDVKRQSLQATSELLLARAPDVILDLHPAKDWTPERLPGELRAWQALSALPAVRSNRVHVLTDERLTIPGPRVAEAARLIAETLHPQAR